MTSWRSSDGVSLFHDVCSFHDVYLQYRRPTRLCEQSRDCVKEGTEVTGADGASEGVAGEATAGAIGGSVASRQ